MSFEADLMPNLDDLITHHDDSNLIQSPEATAAPSSNPSTRQPTLSPPPSTSLQAAQRRAFLARKVVRASELTVSAENAVREAETSFKEALQVIRVTAEDLAKAQVELNQARIGWMYYGAHKRKCEAERAKILAEIAELQQIAGSSDGNPA
ncbi:hypothetical protein OC845_002950 [Tilletia horrida]|nr:hypothetical protein OC845_002950 [Tilletia horrida]